MLPCSHPASQEKKYNFISLSVKNDLDATNEALEAHAQLTSAIEKNLPISADARKLEHNIGMFTDYMEVPSKNKKMLKGVLRHSLRLLQ